MSPPAPTPPRHAGRLTALVFVGVALGLLLYEATKPLLLLPGLTLWESHAVTIAFGSAVAALGVRRALAAQERRHSALRAALHAQVHAESEGRAQAEARAAASVEGEVRFRRLVEQAPEAMVVHARGQFLYVNPACLRLLGADSVDALPTHALLPYIHPDDRAMIAERLAVQAAGGSSAAAEYRVLRLDGSERVVEGTAVPITHDGAPAILTLIRDVTERRQLEAQLTHRALHDALTGLANRALFRDRAARALSGRDRARCAALLVDLDYFKHVNDSLGHAAGDRLLADVAGRLLAATRGCDTVARLGGDEFAVLLERLPHDDDARLVAGRVLAALAAPFHIEGREVSIGASVGIAYAGAEPPAGTGLEGDGAAAADALVRNADLALYAAKAQGRGRHVAFAPAMHAAALARLELEGELRAAVALLEAGDVAGSGFSLAYQPIVDLACGRPTGVEALLRWRPAGGDALVPPMRFIPVAEETGMILSLGRWVLGEACRQAAAWDAAGAGLGGLAVSVNVSGRQLDRPELADDVAAALAASGLAPGRLTLEITETVMMDDAAGTLARLRTLKALGVRVAIDDFGTGYSSLAYLRQFPVDVLKIDKSFVDGVGRGGDEGVLATAIVTLGRALSLSTVAEGIEDAAQLGRLRELGCARGQGYLFARPLPAGELPGWLAARAAGAGASSFGRRAA